MKIQELRFARFAAVALLGLCSLAASSAAATHPLSYPYGMAVDAKGNLYVANSTSNQILVYSPTHTQVTSKTITTNISVPSGVAFDTSGNLWVANQSGNNITEYGPTGTPITSGTISTGINNPQAIAFDGLGDLWVNNRYSELAMYAASQNSPLVTTSTTLVTAIATHQMNMVLGTDSLSDLIEISTWLVNPNGANVSFIALTCYAAGYDVAGNLYCGNQDHTLTVMTPAGTVSTVAQLGFFPTGLALDTKRGYIYVANGGANTIAVYNTSGTLLHTIQ